MGCTESRDSEGNTRPKYRVCTDTFWLGLFIVFWLFLIVIAIFSFVYGNPIRIINGYDSFGNTCGLKTNEHFKDFPLSGMDTSNKPDLFFFDVKELRKSLKICVNHCPKRKIGNSSELYNYYKDENTQLCRYDFNMSILSQNLQSNKDYFNILGPCPTLPVIESSPVLHRCVPKGSVEYTKELYSLLNSWDIAQQFLGDIYSTWHYIAILCGFALILSIVLVIMMHWLTRIVSWLICILVVVASTALCAVLWYAYYNIKHKTDLKIHYSMLEEFIRNEQAVFILAILATITMVVLIIIVYYLKNKLAGLAALFEEAGVCMLELPGLLIAPLIAFVVLIAFLTFWIYVVMCIATANSPGSTMLDPNANVIHHNTTLEGGKSNSQDDYKSLLKVEYVEAKWIRSMFWIYIVGLIWTVEFIFACQQFALAAAVAFWYFNKPTDSPTCYAIGKLLKYHLGTVAKGSFIITLFKIPRLILTYLYTKLKKSEDKGSECAACCLKCCICGFWLLEKFIRFLNHNAYTVVAIESINFCPAAGIAWNAMATNVIQVATINSVGDFVLFLGKLVVAAVTALIGIILLKDRTDLNFYIAPVIIIAVFAFFIAHIILSLFEMVVDTLFLCVCEDKTINGRGGRWAQGNLAKLLGEEPVGPEEAPIQVVEMTPINKQPFSSMTPVPTL
ncbi:choline transporter-like 1 [Episyrphus balteatus]|uniref:choline transporter-like 1 n=1 Tax=Episyrphus balteatus TaxID=286459 RepID=UPI0024867C8B|nr:choline transporter-like 1 [Episyrphus balteatus]